MLLLFPVQSFECYQCLNSQLDPVILSKVIQDLLEIFSIYLTFVNVISNVLLYNGSFTIISSITASFCVVLYYFRSALSVSSTAISRSYLNIS